MNLAKALGSVGGLTLASRVLGLVRDSLFARFVGAGFASDAFLIAFRLPNMFRALFAEGAFSAAFIPTFNRKVGDKDGKLYGIRTAEKSHPGKGTPVTQLDMRRITDGVKVSERYRTTEQVERAFVEDREHTFLYNDGEGYHFMNPESYEQIAVPEDVIGDSAPHLQEGMTVSLSTHNGVPLRSDARG